MSPNTRTIFRPAWVVVLTLLVAGASTGEEPDVKRNWLVRAVTWLEGAAALDIAALEAPEKLAEDKIPEHPRSAPTEGKPVGDRMGFEPDPNG